jgi:large subunit ribosomal protein L15
LPFKRGFTNINKIYYRPVNVGSLEQFAASDEVDPKLLYAAGLLKKPTDPVVILGDGEVSVALSVKAHRFSAAAKAKIEAAGGSASVIEFG